MTVDVRREILKQFYARVETELRLGVEQGHDVAVSGFDYDPEACSISAKIVRLKPGVELPAGQTWTIYHSSKGWPPA